MSSPSPVRRRRTLGSLAAASVLAASALAGPTATAAPGPAPSASAVSGASLDWGVKESFVTYIKGPIAHGDIVASDGASLTADKTIQGWGTGSGSVDVAAGTGQIRFPGKVTFTGHDGLLKTIVAQPEVKLTSPTTGTLVATMTSNDPTGKPVVNGERVELATVKASGPGLVSSGSGDAQSIKLSQATTKLTAEGARAFAGFYSAGEDLSSLSLAGTATAPAAPPAADATTQPRVTGATAKAGLDVEVTGTGYQALPNGLYAAVVDRSLTDAQISQSSAAGVTWVKADQIADGAFRAAVHAPTERLDAKADYDVVVWKAHGTVTPASKLYRGHLPLDSAQRGALFPETAAPAPDPKDGPEEPATTPKPQPEPKPATPPATQAPEPAPKAKKNQDKTAGATERPAASLKGQLSWNVKDSFLAYITGPIAQGKVTASKGARYDAAQNRIVSWGEGASKGSTLYDEKSGKGEFSFPGVISLSGHHGLLETTLGRPTVVLTGKTSGTLRMDVKSNDSTGRQVVNARQIPVAALSFSSSQASVYRLSGKGTAVSTGQGFSLNGATVQLTKQGADAFAGFYPTGQEMSALSLNAVGSGAASAPPAATAPRSGNGASGRSTAAALDVAAALSGKSASGDAASSSASTGQPSGAASRAGAAQQCRTVRTPATAGGASLSWGVKASFRSYIEGGIAKGKITTSSGAARTGTGLSWGAGSGSLSAQGTGTVSFPGAVHFTGHKGVLDTTLSGLRVKVTGPGSGVLIANVSSKGMDGEDLSGTNIEFATLKFSGASASGIQNAQVSLTKAGARSFAGFYSAGQSMDPLQLSVGQSKPATSEVVCGDAAAAALAKTGFGSGGMIGAASALAVLGAALLGLAARRRSSASACSTER